MTKTNLLTAISILAVTSVHHGVIRHLLSWSAVESLLIYSVGNAVGVIVFLPLAMTAISVWHGYFFGREYPTTAHEELKYYLVMGILVASLLVLFGSFYAGHQEEDGTNTPVRSASEFT